MECRSGKNLCQKVLEPIQDALGRTIRSAYRSCAVNQKGSENKNQFNCSANKANYARHIWDRRDDSGYMGATACIIVTSFIPYYEQTQDWTALAWWIHDHIDDYSEMEFFPKFAAFNITWSENPQQPKFIHSYAKNPHTGKKGYLTKPDMENFTGSHEPLYREFMQNSGKSLSLV